MLCPQVFIVRYSRATLSFNNSLFLFFSHLFVEFLNYVPKNRLRIQKIKCIEDLVQTDLFRLPECRDILLPTMLRHIHDMMESQDERTPCIKVLSNIMDALFSPQKKVGTVMILSFFEQIPTCRGKQIRPRSDCSRSSLIRVFTVCNSFLCGKM